MPNEPLVLSKADNGWYGRRANLLVIVQVLHKREQLDTYVADSEEDLSVLELHVVI